MGTNRTQAEHVPRVHYGWWMATIGIVVNGFGSVRQATVPIFFLPVYQELGVSRAALAFIFSIARLEGGIEAPIAGWIIDRFGPRLPTVIGITMGSLGFMLLATAQNYWAYALIYLLMISPSSNIAGAHAMHAVANLWFVRYRTRVLSLFSGSIRLGTAVSTPIIAFIVLNHGWRNGAVFAALVTLIVTLPVALFIRRTPESMGLLPDGGRLGDVSSERGHSKAETTATKELPADFTFKEALHTPSYWIIAFSTMVRLSLNQGVRVHIIPIFVWKGLSEQAGANLLGLLAFTAVPLILMFGWLGDRFNKAPILLLGHVGTVAAMLVIVNFSGIFALLVFALLMALGESTAPVNHSIIGEYFGRKAFATLNGLLQTVGMIGLATPVFAGWVFDMTDSYANALLTFAAVAGIAIVALLFLRRPHLASASASSETDDSRSI